jgi:PadR family transcriptional regulator PadR
MHAETQSRRPFSPVVLHVLLALSDQPRHGYGIMKEVELVSGRTFRIGPGTLYDNLRKLMDDKLVEDLGSDEENGVPRRYQLTKAGAEALAAELEHLSVLLRVGKRRLRSLRSAEET